MLDRKQIFLGVKADAEFMNLPSFSGGHTDNLLRNVELLMLDIRVAFIKSDF